MNMLSLTPYLLVPMATKASVFRPKHMSSTSAQPWSAYAATVLLADLARGYELIAYQSIVAQASSKYQTSVWLKYDRAFRYFTSSTTGVRWDTINHHLWAQCSTGRRATSIACYTCGQPGHVATDCAHIDQFFRPPCEQPQLLLTSPTPLRANPKSAVSSSLVDARTKPHLACPNTNMNLSSATAITQRPRVPARAPINKHKPDTPLQPEVFAMSLHNYLDRTFVESLLWSLCHGFNLGYTGALCIRLSSNLKSALEHKVIVQQGLDLECKRGHMAGPYNRPPLPTLQCSGIGVVPRKNGSWRLIMHLSAPRGLSINDGIIN